MEIDVFRPGKGYGVWTVRVSPDGREVLVEHRLPAEFAFEGGRDNFGAPVLETGYRVEDWRWCGGLALLEPLLVSRKIAREAADAVLRLLPRQPSDART